jgi:acyl-homoserine lactone acylase PvdQ
MGIPHIFAATAPAILFGLGYSLGEDRLAELELRKRSARGTRAEILGKSAVEGDITARDRALPASELMRMYRAIPTEHQKMMQAYVDGINRYIEEVEQTPAKMPYQFAQWGIQPSRWTLLDYLSVIASVPGDRGSDELHNAAFLEAMTARYGPTIGREIFEDVVPISDPDSPTAIPPGEDLAPAQPMPKPGDAFQVQGRDLVRKVSELAPPAPPSREASRCLVIGPQRSAGGHVLMMEATADGPEAHLYGGGFDTAGFSFSGWGAPIMGRSLQHGWLVTSGQADATDMFEERLNPRDRHQYWFNGRWLAMERHLETIRVKGEEAVTHEVAHTVHGPVIVWNTSHGVAYSERYAERGHELDNWVGIVEMARAKNLAEFESKGVARVAWNLGVCYGDSSGQYGFWETGLLPKRAEGADSRLPTPGTGEYEWTGFLDFEERPHMLNPRQGFIHAWNSKATRWSQEGDPARIGKTFRSWLGTQLAESNSSVTLLDMREFNRKINNALGGTDRTATSPAFFAPYVNAALIGNEDPEVAEAAKLMLAFNGLYEDLDKDGYYDSPGLPIFREWLSVAPQMIFGPTMDDWWSKVDEDRYLRYQTSLLLRALQGSEAGLPLKFDYFQGRDRNAVVIQSIRTTVDHLKARYPGKTMSDWRLPIFWKYFDTSKKTPDKPEMPDPDARRSRLSAILGLEPYAVPHNGGDEWTGLMELDPNTQSKIYSVTDTGGQDHFIDARGNGNPHLTDQTRMHADNEFKVIEMSPEKVKATAKSVETINYMPHP